MSSIVRFEVVDRGVATPISIGAGILEGELGRCLNDATGGGCAVIVARRVAQLWGDRLRSAVPGDAAWIELEDSEESKTLDTVEWILDRLFRNQLRRDWTIVCAGGGVTGDVGAFAASIALRGVEVIHVPTTLLAQVDSSIGGKTGVNHASGKNLIGTFHPAAAVISDIGFLSTLGDAEIRGGMFEALKSGVIADEELFDVVVSTEGARPSVETLQRIVAGSARIKSRIVTNDPRETGERRLLNYGHTLGHALEKVLDYHGISHGDAVGRGMIAANAIGVDLGVTPRDVALRISRAVDVLAPAPLPRRVSAEELLQATRLDKKFDTNRMRVIVPTSIGRAEVVEIDEKQLMVGARQMAERS